MKIAVTETEIDCLMNECYEICDEIGSRFPGMSYEEGVIAAIKWILGDDSSYPLQ